MFGFIFLVKRMLRLLEVKNRLDMQTSDKKLTVIYSFNTIYIMDNGAKNNTRLRVPANSKVQPNCKMKQAWAWELPKPSKCMLAHALAWLKTIKT